MASKPGGDRAARTVVATRRLKALTDSVEARVRFPDGPLLVGLSGGADSAALAFLAARHGTARAVHVHHGLPASDHMEAAARSVAQDLDISIDVRRISLSRFSEASARAARYAQLELSRTLDEWILTGHTADDQAETVLANLLRGSGLEGLAGIPIRRGQIVRPLLSVTRSETRELATLAGLRWLDDPTNLDEGPVRNRIRHQLIPQLEAQYNAGLRRHLVSVAQSIADSLVTETPVGESTASGWRVPAGVLWAMGRKKGIDSLRLAVKQMRGGYGLDRAESNRAWGVVRGEASATEVSGGLRISRSGPWVVISLGGLD